MDHHPQDKSLGQVNGLFQEYRNDFHVETTPRDGDNPEKQECKDILIDIPDLSKDIEYDQRYFKDNPYVLCYRCKKYGHISKLCPDEFMDNQRVCYYCLSSDHVYAECRNFVCYKCRKIGHSAKDCTAPEVRLICTSCNKKGHSDATCNMIQTKKFFN